jgi:hypothetical protein
MTARGRSVSVSLADGGGAQVPLLQPDQIVFVAAIPDELTSWERRVVADKELAVVWVDDVKGRAREAAMETLGRYEDRIDRLLVHFDVDVIDFTDFPAADFPTGSSTERRARMTIGTTAGGAHIGTCGSITTRGSCAEVPPTAPGRCGVSDT